MVLLFVYFSGLLVSCLLCLHISSSKDEGLHKIGELLHLTLQLTLICTVANLLVPLLCNLDQDHQSPTKAVLQQYQVVQGFLITFIVPLLTIILRIK